ncbi:hypothetical protein PFLUV_G00136860 [Perca fluviatilis]|uniref:Uncharacterized protein n=1 Tax=Perca fluviatilis TaxID=8168 RepID=A0A6A5E5E5_PERFL|nr:hypothetical protein PFLUV_G00136860 [Perca fluviatilis]
MQAYTSQCTVLNHSPLGSHDWPHHHLSKSTCAVFSYSSSHTQPIAGLYTLAIKTYIVHKNQLFCGEVLNHLSMTFCWLFAC